MSWHRFHFFWHVNVFVHKTVHVQNCVSLCTDLKNKHFLFLVDKNLKKIIANILSNITTAVADRNSLLYADKKNDFFQPIQSIFCRLFRVFPKNADFPVFLPLICFWNQPIYNFVFDKQKHIQNVMFVYCLTYFYTKERATKKLFSY